MTGAATKAQSLYGQLERAMQQKIPSAKLAVQALPMVPEIKLALIDGTYPQEQLSAAQVEYLMDEPPIGHSVGPAGKSWHAIYSITPKSFEIKP